MNKAQRFLFETRMGDRLLGLLECHIGLSVSVAGPEDTEARLRLMPSQCFFYRPGPDPLGLGTGVAKPAGVSIGFSISFAAAHPKDGQQIDVKYPSGNWGPATYHDDGINGIVVDENGETEIEEYSLMLWRPIEWRKAE